MFFALYLVVMMLLAGGILGFLLYDLTLKKSEKTYLLDILANQTLLFSLSAAFLFLVSWPVMIVVALIIYFCRAWEH
jgi:hypothetical protein